MNEIYQQILAILHGMWRRRWYALAGAWVVSAIGWGVVAKIPDKYESSARIYVDTETMLRPLMKGLAVDVNILAQISVMQRTLLSRPNIEKVIRMTDLDLQATTDLDMQKLVKELSENIRISFQGANLFRISYENEDPQLAKRVVQSLLTIFVEGNLGASRKDLAGARRFIDEQLRDYERQLDEAEQRRARFKQENMIFYEGKGTYYESVKAARTDLAALERERKETILVRNQLAAQLKSLPRYIRVQSPLGPPGMGPMVGTSGKISALQSRILEYRRSLDNLLLRYTEKHPDVVAVKRALAAAEQELGAEQSALAARLDGDNAEPADVVGNTTVLNPVYEQVQLKIVEAGSKIATLNSRLATQRELVAKLSKMASTVPVIEAEVERLNRDYTVIKKKYEELLSRREQARIAQDLETKSDKVQFRIIEPPQVSLEPSSPNRPLFLSLAMVIGVGAGLALAFLLSQLHHTFSSVEQLRATYDLPVVGAVSQVVFEANRRQRKLENAIYSAVSIGLFAAYGLLMALEMFLGPGTA
jgi:polysaccharide chain length determinant protein (PEP-CTERM system associated)